MKNNNKLVILIGSPGSGKGTQAHLLAGKKKMPHLEASKLLEKKFLKTEDAIITDSEGNSYSLSQQKDLWRNGHLCEDGFVTCVIKEALEKIKKGVELILLDGYPRTIRQAELAIPFLFSFYDPKDVLVISLDVTEEESLKRNSNRRVCSLMRHSIISHKETNNLTICPVDGSPLERRILDNPETIKIRLKDFKERTQPIIDYFEKKDVFVSRIDGSGSISDVFERVLKTVNNFGI